MPSPTYALVRNAILAERQVTCTYEGRRRELCPHIVVTSKSGEEVVLAWQFAGEGSGKLPHESDSHRTTQTCVSDIDLDINVHVRKRRKPVGSR